jgi:hypothetical protein
MAMGWASRPFYNAGRGRSRPAPRSVRCGVGCTGKPVYASRRTRPPAAQAGRRVSRPPPPLGSPGIGDVPPARLGRIAPERLVRRPARKTRDATSGRLRPKTNRPQAHLKGVCCREHPGRRGRLFPWIPRPWQARWRFVCETVIRLSLSRQLRARPGAREAAAAYERSLSSGCTRRSRSAGT